MLPLLEPHHDVVAATLRGRGGGEPFPPGAEVSLDAIVDGVEADLDRAGLTTVHLVGNSLGGWVALELACRGRVRSVVLFGPGGAWGSTARITAVTTTIRWTLLVFARLSATRMPSPRSPASAPRSWG